eukprot:scaffold50508_cov30-Tisochrysis_lutea.AAC.2
MVGNGARGREDNGAHIPTSIENLRNSARILRRVDGSGDASCRGKLRGSKFGGNTAGAPLWPKYGQSIQTISSSG